MWAAANVMWKTNSALRWCAVTPPNTSNVDAIQTLKDPQRASMKKPLPGQDSQAPVHRGSEPSTCNRPISITKSQR